MVCGGFVCAKNALSALNVVYLVSDDEQVSSLRAGSHRSHKSVNLQLENSVFAMETRAQVAE